ncbi:hypothetical protein BKA82DRAFT_4414934 [Pisolithus tinctorius]|nr:hypothetical protein BKA82DRAFT_4414934 [Pisolithus tinctorius]
MSISLVFTPFLSLFGRLVLLDNNSSLLLIVFIALSPSPMPDSSAAHSSDSSSSASLSSDLYDSTPSPPTKLEDQVQVAYTLDDIRLAKTLLLKLKGIEVTGSDDDPRIDEDFDVYFVPSGPLALEEADGRPMEGTQCKQRTSGDALCRDNNVTQGSVFQARAERYSYSNPTREETPFQYSFMVPTNPSGPTSTRQVIRSPRTAGKQAATDLPRPTVCFKEVVKCMKGRLFPPHAPEQVEDARCTVGLDSLSNNTRHRCRPSARTQLLDNLLQPVEWKGDRWKAQAAGVPCRRVANLRSPSSMTQHPYPPPPSSESLTSMSSPLSSRSNSRVSFGSWRSSCTDVTIPDTQVATPSECSLPVLLPSTHENQWDYHYPRCSFIPISLEESPLTLPRPLQSERQASGDNRNGVVSAERAASSSGRMRQSVLHRVS